MRSAGAARWLRPDLSLCLGWLRQRLALRTHSSPARCVASRRSTQLCAASRRSARGRRALLGAPASPDAPSATAESGANRKQRAPLRAARTKQRAARCAFHRSAAHRCAVRELEAESGVLETAVSVSRAGLGPSPADSLNLLPFREPWHIRENRFRSALNRSA